ncbi:MAG: hypothetical protein HY821_15370 [Acidobacteria bacterium]|nr:hypothetical protein [Acidobacteriota bacterium]
MQNASIRGGNPLLRPASIALAMLSLSIGWGMRGNYGHETGAMMPGALCAIAISLFSAREDWRQRLPSFAVFGALGWGFGGSMSYMVPMGYTQSGEFASQIYGFVMVFLLGFLWSSMGVAGTAYAAAEEREKLTALYKPMSWVFATWALWTLLEPAVLRWYSGSMGLDAGRMFRQRNPFYWLDSDWLEASLALAAVCLFDLWDRRFAKAGRLIGFGAGGAAAGFAVQHGLAAAGLLDSLLAAIVQVEGDLAAINKATGQPYRAEELITNWPQVFTDLGPHLGWVLGLAAGLAVYFWLYGKFRSGASLIAHIAVGGLAVFVAGPVLLSNLFGGVGGFRMVPPRGDNWAMVLGYFLGMVLYMRKNGLAAVAAAGTIGGVLGGVGFMLAQFVKMLAWMPGNPLLTQDQATIQWWDHWRKTNWHSLVTEQFVGLLYGLATVLAMALVWRRTAARTDEPRVRRWTELWSVSFVVNGIAWMNLWKNVGDYTSERSGGFRSVPESMKLPLFGAVELSAEMWFHLLFGLFTALTIALLAAHRRKPLALVPASWLGKGQLLYVVFVWMLVIGNFDKALVSFTERRLVTEALIFVHALIATYLLLTAAPEAETVQTEEFSWAPWVRRALACGAAAVVLLTGVFVTVERGMYGDKPDGFGGGNKRFGPAADWRVKAIVKDRQHM